MTEFSLTRLQRRSSVVRDIIGVSCYSSRAVLIDVQVGDLLPHSVNDKHPVE